MIKRLFLFAVSLAILVFAAPLRASLDPADSAPAQAQANRPNPLASLVRYEVIDVQLDGLQGFVVARMAPANAVILNRMLVNQVVVRQRFPNPPAVGATKRAPKRPILVTK